MFNILDKRKKKSNRQNLSIHQHEEYYKLMRLLKNRYSYTFKSDEQKKELEDSLPFRYLESIVAEYGRVAVYKSKKYGVAIYKTTGAGINLYGLPNKFFLFGSNGTRYHTVDADDKDLLILTDVFNARALREVAYRYSLILGKIRETIVTNVHSMRTPFLIKAPKEQILAVKLALQAINEENEVMVDESSSFVEDIKVIELKTPDNLKSLEDSYNNTFAKYKEEIGYSSQPIDKKERLVAAEAESDNSTLIAFDNEPFESRLKFIEQMREKFGIDLNLIKANNDILVEENDKVIKRESVKNNA